MKQESRTPSPEVHITQESLTPSPVKTKPLRSVSTESRSDSPSRQLYNEMAMHSTPSKPRYETPSQAPTPRTPPAIPRPYRYKAPGASSRSPANSSQTARTSRLSLSPGQLRGDSPMSLFGHSTPLTSRYQTPPQAPTPRTPPAIPRPYRYKTPGASSRSPSTSFQTARPSRLSLSQVHFEGETFRDLLSAIASVAMCGSWRIVGQGSVLP